MLRVASVLVLCVLLLNVRVGSAKNLLNLQAAVLAELGMDANNIRPLREMRDESELPDLAQAVEEAEGCALGGEEFFPSLSDAEYAKMERQREIDEMKEEIGFEEEAVAQAEAKAATVLQKISMAKRMSNWVGGLRPGKMAKKIKSALKFKGVRKYMAKRYKFWKIKRSRAEIAGALKRFPNDPTAKCFRTLRLLPQVQKEDFDLLTFCQLTTERVCGDPEQEAAEGMEGSAEGPGGEEASFDPTRFNRTVPVSEAIKDPSLALPISNAGRKQQLRRVNAFQESDVESLLAKWREEEALLKSEQARAPAQFRTKAIQKCHQMLIEKTYEPMERQIKELIWKKRKNLLGVALKLVIIGGAIATAILVPPVLGLGVVGVAGLGTGIAAGSFAAQNAVDSVTGHEKEAFSIGKIRTWGKTEGCVFFLSIAAGLLGAPLVPAFRIMTGLKNARTQLRDAHHAEKAIHREAGSAVLPEQVMRGNETLDEFTRKNTRESSIDSSDSLDLPPSSPRAGGDGLSCPLSRRRPDPDKDARWTDALDIARTRCKPKTGSSPPGGGGTSGPDALHLTAVGQDEFGQKRESPMPIWKVRAVREKTAGASSSSSTAAESSILCELDDEALDLLEEKNPLGDLDFDETEKSK